MIVGYLIFARETYMLHKQIDIDLTWINRNRLLTIQYSIENIQSIAGCALCRGKQASDKDG